MVFAVDEEGLLPADGSDWEPLHFGGAVGHDEGMVYRDNAFGGLGMAGGVEVGGHFGGVDIADGERGRVERDRCGARPGRQGGIQVHGGRRTGSGGPRGCPAVHVARGGWHGPPPAPRAARGPRCMDRRQHLIGSLDTLLYQLHALSFFLAPALLPLLARIAAQAHCRPRPDDTHSLRFFLAIVLVLNLPSLWYHAIRAPTR
jgi:hypothetical protein